MLVIFLYLVNHLFPSNDAPFSIELDLSPSPSHSLTRVSYFTSLSLLFRQDADAAKDKRAKAQEKGIGRRSSWSRIALNLRILSLSALLCLSLFTFISLVHQMTEILLAWRQEARACFCCKVRRIFLMGRTFPSPSASCVATRT